MRKLRLLFHLFIFITAIILFVYLNYNLFREYEQDQFGGIVENNTKHNIIISDTDSKAVLLPGKSSRDIGIFDTDYIFIDRPTLFEGKLYSSGIVKFCDFATIKVVSKANVDELHPLTFSFVCKLVDDLNWQHIKN